jgi:hypothetical protein
MKAEELSTQPLLAEDESFWRRHAELYQSSGLTRKKYCQMNNVNYDRFGYWLSKITRHSSSLVAIKLKAESAPLKQITLCTLNFRDGRTLQIHDQQALSYILEKLS